MNKNEALKMAIVALESSGGKFFDKEINACKEALEQPAQEPLSEDEISKMQRDYEDLLVGGGTMFHFMEFARAIEQAHGIGVK